MATDAQLAEVVARAIDAEIETAIRAITAKVSDKYPEYVGRLAGLRKARELLVDGFETLSGRKAEKLANSRPQLHQPDRHFTEA